MRSPDPGWSARENILKKMCPQQKVGSAKCAPCTKRPQNCNMLLSGYNAALDEGFILRETRSPSTCQPVLSTRSARQTKALDLQLHKHFLFCSSNLFLSISNTVFADFHWKAINFPCVYILANWVFSLLFINEKIVKKSKPLKTPSYYNIDIAGCS